MHLYFVFTNDDSLCVWSARYFYLVYHFIETNQKSSNKVLHNVVTLLQTCYFFRACSADRCVSKISLFPQIITL